jgi:hypothetical protein
MKSKVEERNYPRVSEGSSPKHSLYAAVKSPKCQAGRYVCICTSASHDPEQIHKSPSAHIQIAEVDIPGAGTP